MALNDDMMEAATGGLADTDPYGYVCEGTIIKSAGSAAGKTMYSVDADNGRKYWATWSYETVLSKGERVQLIHADDGSYILEAIID